MTELKWGQSGEKRFETGVSKGVLYRRDAGGAYNIPSAWNGLVSISESPSGAEPNKQYADNTVYANLISAEEFAATIEAFTYPDDFEFCDGSASPAVGISIGQQNREVFGLSYQTLIGNDLTPEAGFKIHLVYGAQAAPSEKAYQTVNDSPEAMTFSWEVSTTPVSVPGFKPTATLVIDSTKVAQADLDEIMALLYGTAGQDAYLPLPEEVAALIGATTEVTATAPTATAAGVITIPSVTGVQYYRDDTGAAVAAGTVTITGAIGTSLIISAKAKSSYKLKPMTDDDWSFTKTA